MILAIQEAARFSHEYVESAHILLGLIKERTGIAANVLKNMGTDLRAIRAGVEKFIGVGPDTATAGNIPQSPRTRKVVEYSREEAQNLGHHNVGTEHLLLGLLREEDGAAARILVNLGLQLEEVRREVQRQYLDEVRREVQKRLEYGVTASNIPLSDLMNSKENDNVSKYFQYTLDAVKIDETGKLMRREALKEIVKMNEELKLYDNTKLLHDAAKNGDIDFLSVLLNAGINIDTCNDYGWTPLFYAVRSKRTETVKFLIEKGANVNAQDEGGKTPLHVAVNGNSTNIIGILVKAGADTELKDKSGNTARFVAKRGGRHKAEKVLSDVPRLLQDAMREARRKAISQRDIYTITEADFDLLKYTGMTQLAHAVENGNVEAVKFLIGRGADVNKKIKGGGTPLHIAAYKNYMEIAALLIEAEADVNMKDLYGETPLHQAALKNSQVLVPLIKAGANLNAQDNKGDCPLHFAAEKNSVDSIIALIEAGANIDLIGYGGRTPLFEAIAWNRVEAVKFLVEAGANVNFRVNLASSVANGESPIHTAALFADTEIMAALLDAGADIDAQPKHGKKAIDYAIRGKRKEIVQFLLERGATVPDLLDYSSANDPWARAEQWYNEVKKSDKKFNESPSGTDIDNLEHLCHAVRQGDIESVTLLLHKRRTNVNTLDKRGYSPIHWAALEGNIEIMALLLENGADLNLRTEENSPPLFLTIWRYMINRKREANGLPIEKKASLEAMLFLLEQGAEIDAVNVGGLSLLHISASYGEIEMMRILLDKSADIELQCKAGKTPLHYVVCSTPIKLGAVKPAL